MKRAGLPGSTATAPQVSGNGAHRAAKRSGQASKRSVGSDAGAGARSIPKPSATPETAAFAIPEAAALDAPMWPLHPSVWFQPDLAPSPPDWSGLATERANRIPAPDFLHSGAAPLDRPDSLDHSRDALTPGARPQVPQSDGAPLGWDPRAVSREERHE